MAYSYEGLMSAWENETNDPKTQEWRDDLTADERKLVEQWDDNYEQALAQLVLLSRANSKQAALSDQKLVGQATYISGEVREFQDAEEFLACIREELEHRATTGFNYKVLTDDPSVRKAADDIVYDHYGEENPFELEYYKEKYACSEKLNAEQQNAGHFALDEPEMEL